MFTGGDRVHGNHLLLVIGYFDIKDVNEIATHSHDILHSAFLQNLVPNQALYLSSAVFKNILAKMLDIFMLISNNH